MLGQLTREQESDSGLDFARGDGGPLVVVGKAGSLSSDALKDVVDKGVHDAHGLGGDTSVGVDLLEDLVDVDGVGLLSLAVLGLLVTLGDVLGGLAGLLDSLSGSLGGHVDTSEVNKQLIVTERYSPYLLERVDPMLCLQIKSLRAISFVYKWAGKSVRRLGSRLAHQSWIQ